MVFYPLSLLQELAIPTTVVVGHQKDLVEELIANHYQTGVAFSHQDEQLGTAHAVSCALETLSRDHVLVMNADTPLVTKEIIKQLIDNHYKHTATISFVVAHNADPSGYSYGRLVQTKDDMRIVASHDFTGDYHEHCLVDAGIYLIQREFLISSLPHLAINQRTGETYLSDLIALADRQRAIITLTHAPFDRIRSIDTLQELWAAEHIKRSDLIRDWMSKGVRFTQPQTAHIDLSVTIGKDSVIGAGVHLTGSTRIGKGCTIREYSILENTVVGDHATVLPHSFISNTSIKAKSMIGPYAHDTGKAIINHIEQSNENISFVGAIKTHDTSHQHDLS